MSFAPLTLDFNADNSTYTVTGTTKDVHAETTWHLIVKRRRLTPPRHAA